MAVSPPECPYDAVLLLSFGGPQGPDDVMPFLRRVTAGRGVPEERLAVVAKQYLHFGGRSPINDQNEQLRQALAHELGLPVYLGNRNWDPLVADTFRQMRADGIRSTAVVITSGYASYSGCRQYREDLAAALAEIEADEQDWPIQIQKIKRWSPLPQFAQVMADNVTECVNDLLTDSSKLPRIVFTTHSIPLALNDASGDPRDGGGAYLREHTNAINSVMKLLNERFGTELDWDLVYQSRSGSPRIPWLEPDIADHLEALCDKGVGSVVIVPIGFASDHLEVLWDLDNLALTAAQECGINARRAKTVGADPRFVQGIAGLVRNGDDEICPLNCCLNPHSSPRPTICGVN